MRAYEDTPLSREELSFIELAVLSAPTGRDLKELRYYFITDRSVIDKIDARIFHYSDESMRATMKVREATSFFYGASLAVIITGEETPWIQVDAGIAVQTLTLAAKSLDLSSVILGNPRHAFKPEDPENCMSLIGMDAKEHFCISIAIGHAKHINPPHLHEPKLIITRL